MFFANAIFGMCHILHAAGIAFVAYIDLFADTKTLTTTLKPTPPSA
jgi:hypothetical protein